MGWLDRFKEDYRNSLKSMDTEETVDLLFYRPIGYVWARLAKWLGVTPNAITIASIFLGVGAGVLMYFNDIWINLIGILLLVWANSFDSADGQLARMTGQYSKFGRILDGISGDLWFVSIYVAICLRVIDTTPLYSDYPWLIWLVAILAGGCHAKQHNCKKLVFSSSATVYGDPEVLPLTEECKTGGTTNPYGTSKYFQEIILTDLNKSDNDWTVVLLRYFNPVGAHESGLIGEDPQGIPNNLTPFIAKVAIGELAEIGVFGNDYDTPDGTGVRDYIHVVDLAKGHVAAIDGIKESGRYVYNLGTGNGYSVLQVIDAFGKACNKKLPFAIKPRRAGDIATCYADASKAKRELGWEATHNIDDMCASLWNWQSKNPKGYKN